MLAPTGPVLPLVPTDGILKNRPLYGNMLQKNGECVWPTSFYACNIIDGFEKIEQLTCTWLPRHIHQNTAFKTVYGLKYAKTTYSHHKIYYCDNTQLVKKYHSLGYIENGSWKAFVKEAEAGQAILDLTKSNDETAPPALFHSTDTNSTPACAHLAPPVLPSTSAVSHKPIDTIPTYDHELKILKEGLTHGWP
ncbi:hypothetical protein BDQ12DRAFT_724300 [Crucibulum laeve]|uniref:Uncharacterized protein n=1 Tax=Crucibulum laeve TaxID=68775 RepID=A0A5C3LWF7_9AGAR|nr:hypothetical protein BDQ12DRAFT_724300 [Crucibulum laeve]